MIRNTLPARADERRANASVSEVFTASTTGSASDSASVVTRRGTGCRAGEARGSLRERTGEPWTCETRCTGGIEHAELPSSPEASPRALLLARRTSILRSSSDCHRRIVGDAGGLTGVCSCTAVFVFSSVSRSSPPAAAMTMLTPRYVSRGASMKAIAPRMASRPCVSPGVPRGRRPEAVDFACKDGQGELGDPGHGGTFVINAEGLDTNGRARVRSYGSSVTLATAARWACRSPSRCTRSARP